jgi:hypothetical protein
MELAGAGIFNARWTNMIHDEWISSLLASRPELDPARLARTRMLMDEAVLDSIVEGFEPLINTLKLPDPNDRHVLAAAIHSGSGAIITFNLKDFPPEVAKRYRIEILHPDEFLQSQLKLDPAAVISAAKNCRARLLNPSKSAEEYLQTLKKQSLPQLVDRLGGFKHLI